MMRFGAAIAAVVGMAGAAVAQAELDGLVEAERDAAIAIARDVWGYAELGYLETQSTARLQGYLRDAGFEIETGVAGMPTSFIASAGDGEPVIAILAEFDALPGMSQAAVPERQPVTEGAPGHACGHHLFGAASAAAGVAVARWLEQSGTAGTVRVYGTPAEEGGSAKVYMTRAGLFRDVDVVLHWHPNDRNEASPKASTANKSGRFTFTGKAAHAASAPDQGRSALDGVEAMNYMVNMMREHVPQESRIHYVITDGGDAPNIVPEHAQVYYYVRHPDQERVKALFERVVSAAEGAARGTGTEMRYEVMHGNFPLLPSETLSAVVHEELVDLGGIGYTAKETAFANKLRESLVQPALPLASSMEIEPSRPEQGMGSTDVGDVSWNVPTVGFGTATWVPGTPAHSWQAVAAGGTSIGEKGMMLAAKVLARTAERLYSDAALIRAARTELERDRGADFVYTPLLGDRDPPLDYRR